MSGISINAINKDAAGSKMGSEQEWDPMRHGDQDKPALSWPQAYHAGKKSRCGNQLVVRKPKNLNPKLLTYLERDHQVHSIPNVPDVSLPQVTRHADPRELWEPEGEVVGPGNQRPQLTAQEVPHSCMGQPIPYIPHLAIRMSCPEPPLPSHLQDCASLCRATPANPFASTPKITSSPILEPVVTNTGFTSTACMAAKQQIASPGQKILLPQLREQTF